MEIDLRAPLQRRIVRLRADCALATPTDAVFAAWPRSTHNFIQEHCP
jgi:hypothetical protein